MAGGAFALLAFASVAGFLTQYVLGVNNAGLVGRIVAGAAATAPFALVGGILGIMSYKGDPKEPEDNMRTGGGKIVTPEDLGLYTDDKKNQ